MISESIDFAGESSILAATLLFKQHIAYTDARTILGSHYDAAMKGDKKMKDLAIARARQRGAK